MLSPDPLKIGFNSHNGYIIQTEDLIYCTQDISLGLKADCGNLSHLKKCQESQYVVLIKISTNGCNESDKNSC